jgi:hypothetical protein
MTVELAVNPVEEDFEAKQKQHTNCKDRVECCARRKFRFGLHEEIKTDIGDTKGQNEKNKAAQSVDLPEGLGIKLSLLPAEHLEHAYDADKGHDQQAERQKRFYEEYMHGTPERDRGAETEV